MTAEEIWEGDLFGRFAESDQLIGFLETVGTRPSMREDGHAYVLAVDSPYGEGKSYFLRRFAEHMALSHPVAFVDAWTDDLDDEPLVALAATLERAFSNYADKSGELKARLTSVINKTGRVAKIAAEGFLKRGVSILITSAATEAASAVIEEVSDANSEGIGKAVDDVVDDAQGEISKMITPPMKVRIDRFNQGRQAVKAMKQSLRELVAFLGRDDVYPPPIVIVIDELDRCRPTYAIKLLEEVKHLFDVEGLVFVLGMHGAALGHSVSAAYGAKFDGVAYLGRFVNRRYKLRDAPIRALLSSLFSARGIAIDRLEGGSFIVNGRNSNSDVVALIALLMKSHGLNARDVFGVVDRLEVCLAVTGGDRLIVPYLLPLIFSQMRGGFGISRLSETQNWKYVLGGSFRATAVEWLPDELALRFEQVSRMTDNELMEAVNADNADFVIRTVGSATFDGPRDKLSSPKNYIKLIETVSRFSDPARPND